MTGFEWINQRAVSDAIKDAGSRMEKAAVFAIAQVGFAVERQAKLNANTYTRRQIRSRRGGKVSITYDPPHHIGPKGSGPNRITGNLIRSIHTDTHYGFGKYVAEVFPTMEYARKVEQDYDYPYLRPAADKISRRANDIFLRAFRQKYKG